MGKSVDFCHIIIIWAIITVYRTAGRETWIFCSLVLYWEKTFFTKWVTRGLTILPSHVMNYKAVKIRQQTENINFCKRIYFRHFAITFSFRKFVSNALRMKKKKEEWNVNELVIMFVVRPYCEKGTCSGFISDIAWNNHDSRTGYNLPSRNTKRPEYILIKRSLLCKIQTDSAQDYGKNEDEFN